MCAACHQSLPSMQNKKSLTISKLINIDRSRIISEPHEYITSDKMRGREREKFVLPAKMAEK